MACADKGLLEFSTLASLESSARWTQRLARVQASLEPGLAPWKSWFNVPLPLTKVIERLRTEIGLNALI